MDPNKSIPFSVGGENVNLIFNEVSKRSERTVCIEGRHFRVLPSGDNPAHIQQIQDKIAKLASEPNLTMKEFFCNVLSCKESALTNKNLEVINALQTSILSTPDQKKGSSEFATRVELASQRPLYAKLLTSLEEKEKNMKQLSEEISDLMDTAYYRGPADLIDSIQSIAASLKLPRLEAQYKEHRVELLKIKFQLHQLLPTNTEENKRLAADSWTSMLCDAIVTEHVAYTNQLIKAGGELKYFHFLAAVIANSGKMIDIIVKEGLDPNHQTDGRSLIWIACLRGQNAAYAIEALVRNGASLITLNADGDSPINEAITSDLDEKQVIALLEKVQRPNFQDGSGRSLLHEAITRISFDRGNVPFKYLLDVQKATPNVKDATGATPLHHAIARLEEKSLPVVEKLIEKGAIVTALDNKGQTPLHIAARMSNEITQVGKRDHGAIVRALIKAGAAVNATDLKGRTALHEAVKYGINATNLRSVEELIKGGIDLDIQDEDGNTALHLAIAGEHVDLVELLLKHGANRNLRDNAGRLPGAAGFVVSDERRQKILGLLAKI